MVILKIKQKGLYIEIPGTLPTRTPAEINITKCNLAVVDAYMRKLGINDYEILSKHGNKIKPSLPDIKDSSINQKLINKRFTNLEKLVEKLIEKEQVNTSPNSEQINDKLATLEHLTRKLLEKEPFEVEKKKKSKRIKSNSKFKKEPVVEELEDKFIPDIDLSGMKMKKGSKKTIKQDNIDLDDSADLLSRIMGNED